MPTPPLIDRIGYAELMKDALMSVVRNALERVEQNGLPGAHHFFITFRSDSLGVEMSTELKARYPREMTIVLQHRFFNLEVRQDGFSVGLSFNKITEWLSVPFDSIRTFVDPSVNFGLQLEHKSDSAESDPTNGPRLVTDDLGYGSEQGNAKELSGNRSGHMDDDPVISDLTDFTGLADLEPKPLLRIERVTEGSEGDGLTGSSSSPLSPVPHDLSKVLRRKLDAEDSADDAVSSDASSGLLNPNESYESGESDRSDSQRADSTVPTATKSDSTSRKSTPSSTPDSTPSSSKGDDTPEDDEPTKPELGENVVSLDTFRNKAS